MADQARHDSTVRASVLNLACMQRRRFPNDSLEQDRRLYRPTNLDAMAGRPALRAAIEARLTKTHAAATSCYSKQHHSFTKRLLATTTFNPSRA